LSGALKARALRLLARREHSRAELARKLAPHAETPQALSALLDDLARKNQLSDERFAEARTRVLARKYGAARIRHDLGQKGVAKHLVEKVSSEGERERAGAILARRYPVAATTLKERARRARFLQGRGFPVDLIQDLLDVVEP
jgi:regulatory protein